MYFSTCKFGIHGNKQTHLDILLKLKLVSHILSNRHKILPKVHTLVVLLKKRGFDFWISTSDVELCGDKTLSLNKHTQLYLHTAQHLKLIPKNGNPSFFSKTIKVPWVKFHTYWINMID